MMTERNPEAAMTRERALEEALRPFAALLNQYTRTAKDEWKLDELVHQGDLYLADLTIGDLRAARAALASAQQEPAPPADVEEIAFRVGEPVIKSSGYDFPGVVRAVFTTSGGAIRYVVEHSTSVGLLHIFNESQLTAARAKPSEKGGAR